MYCPKCKVEYRDGFTECSDCKVELQAGSPPAEAAPEPDLELVQVIECDDPVELALAKGTLDDAGVYHVDRPRMTEFGVGYVYATPYIHAPTEILVALKDEARARELLEPISEVAATEVTEESE